MGRTSFTLDEIYDLTEGGLNVYENELGQISFARNTKAPWRSDSSPSLQFFFAKDGRVLWKDWGENEVGNCFHFIMKMYQLNFYEALQKIKEDLGLEEKRNFYERKAVNSVFKPVRQKNIIIDWEEGQWTKAHRKYWEQYSLPPDFVTSVGNIYPVSKWAINKKIQIATKEELIFAYNYINYEGKETGLSKILRIGKHVLKADKWRTNVPANKLWYAYKYQQVNQLFISKSNKDALCIIKQGIACINTQSENDKVLIENIPWIKEKFTSDLILNYGSDPQGVQASKAVSEKFNLKWFNVPKVGLRWKIQDNADYIKFFGEESFRNLLIKKRYLKQTPIKNKLKQN